MPGLEACGLLCSACLPPPFTPNPLQPSPCLSSSTPLTPRYHQHRAFYPETWQEAGVQGLPDSNISPLAW